MAWGGISKKGKTPLFCFINIMDRPFYMSILQNQLLPAARSMYRRNWRLQQDNDLKHTSLLKILLLKIRSAQLIGYSIV